MLHVAKPAETIAMFNVNDLKQGAKTVYERKVQYLDKINRCIAHVEDKFQNNVKFGGATWYDAKQDHVTVKYWTYVDPKLFETTVREVLPKCGVRQGKDTTAGKEMFIQVSFE